MCQAHWHNIIDLFIYLFGSALIALLTSQIIPDRHHRIPTIFCMKWEPIYGPTVLADFSNFTLIVFIAHMNLYIFIHGKSNKCVPNNNSIGINVCHIWAQNDCVPLTLSMHRQFCNNTVNLSKNLLSIKPITFFLIDYACML